MQEINLQNHTKKKHYSQHDIANPHHGNNLNTYDITFPVRVRENRI